MAVTTWVLILLVIGLAILLAIVTREFQPKAARKAHVEQAINQDTSMENSEDLSPIHSSKVSELPMIPETPWEYGENEITLLLQDPFNLYAYWEITEKTYRDLQSRLGDDYYRSTPVLRLFHINQDDRLDISLIANQPISDEQRSWYFHLGKPEGIFYVEIGRYLVNGSFILITRSNLIETPADKISDIIDENWALVDRNQQLLYQGQLTSQRTGSEIVSSFSLFQQDDINH